MLDSPGDAITAIVVVAFVVIVLVVARMPTICTEMNSLVQT